MTRHFLGCLGALLVLGQAGCNTVGPRAVRSGVDYNMALQYTSDQQLLLNIVRLRYRDTPSFMEIASVSTAYTLGADASIEVGYGRTSDALSLGSLKPKVGVRYDERPTVTYQPLRGESFVKQMLTPISAKTLLLLYYSGWSIERLFRCAVFQFHDLPNAPAASGPTPKAAPRFEEFIEVTRVLRSLQSRGVIFLVANRLENQNQEMVFLEIDKVAVNDPEVEKLRELLGLRPGKSQYPLVADLEAKGSPDAILMGTRSVMGMLFFLSHGVEIPPEDRAAGLVTDTRYPDGSPFDWSRVTAGLFKVRSDGQDRSGVSVDYRGRTFSIDDSDLDSKSTFMFVAQMLALQSGSTKTVSPLLTIPVAR